MTSQPSTAFTAQNPLRIDLGCGPYKKAGFLGVDIAAVPGVDIVADLSKMFPFGDSSVDELRAYDVIEHLVDRIHTMNEIWRISKPGATIDIRVPSSDGRGAFQDPTHVSFWNINSFKYYCSEFPAYLNLCQQYGFKGAFRLTALSHEESGEGVIHVRAKLEVIKPLSKGDSLPRQSAAEKLDRKELSQPNSPNSRALPHKSFEKEGISLNLKLNIDQYRQNSGDKSALSKLRQERWKIAQQILSSESESLENNYKRWIKETHQALCNSGIKLENLTAKESDFLIQTLKNLESAEGYDYLKGFLIALLYTDAFKIPTTSLFSSLPPWALNKYIQYYLSPPHQFQNIHNTDEYCEKISQFITNIHKEISTKNQATFNLESIEIIARSMNFIPIYFNERNLRDLYTSRSNLLEEYLKETGHQVDYQFSSSRNHRIKIRLGILAAHFEGSAETFFSLSIYEYISREFDVTLYSLKPLQTEIAKYCGSCANAVKVLPQTLQQQVESIRQDDLDLLFIGTNLTAVTNSICLLSIHRLARVQITSVTSITTTGFRHMDYFLSGELTDPSSLAQEHYREQLVKVPGSIHCFSYGDKGHKPNQSTIISREDFDIPEDTVLYTSAANFFKCIPELLHTWAKILARVPNSRLMLFPFGPNWSNSYPKQSFTKQVSHIFEEYDVARERILILDPQPVPDPETLKSYLNIADIYLDSYPVCGTTSLMEPLAIGLPTVSRKGQFLRGAMGAAMLEAIKLHDLVTDSEQTYIELAIALGTDNQLYNRLQQQVRQRMQDRPAILDSQTFGHIIGNLFKQFIVDYHAQELAEQFHLRTINLLIFPDWSASEEDLLESLAEVIQAIAHHPTSESITLLLDGTGIDEENANLALSSVAMNLMMMAEEPDIYESLELSFIESLTKWQWQALLSQVKGRVKLPMENTGAIANTNAYQLQQVSINGLNELEIHESE